ncbi:MAG TPA: GGDEF domain-containing protein [Rectinemataceae bacterium]|nr:GGDEF domain-containing protein [Rectinemataceae bacterium]
MSDSPRTIDELNSRAWEIMLTTPLEALALAEDARSRSERLDYPAGTAEAELNVAWCEYFLTRYSSAIGTFQRALDGFTALGDREGLMKAYNGLGGVYQGMARYERAMDYYTRSLEEARLAGNATREATTLNNIGEICLELGEFKEALDYFLHAYEIVPEDKNSELLSNVLLNIGTAFHRMENWPLAREFTEKSLEIAAAAQERIVEAQCLHSLGRIAQTSDQPALAEERYTRALAIDEELKNDRQRAAVLLDLGSLYVQTTRIERALEVYHVALESAERIESKALMHAAYERLSEAFEILGRFQEALDYYRRFARYEHEVLNEDTSRKIKNVTVQYEVDKSRQEAEIYRLKNIELKEKTEALEEANRQILAIAEMGQKITSSLDFDTIATTLRSSLSPHLDTSCFGIALYHEDEGSIEWGVLLDGDKRLHQTERKADPDSTFSAWAILHRRRIWINDAEREHSQYKSKRSTVGRPAQSLVFMPLNIEDRPIGLLTVQSYEKNAYSEKQIALLEALAPYLAIALENSIIHDRLEELNRAMQGEKEKLEKDAIKIAHLANHDLLTGLPNRRLLFELLQKTFDISSRSGARVVVMYLDLDDFKPINDRYGHSAGDQALVVIAKRLRALLRASDTVARVGGDEFIIVLSNVPDREGVELAARKIIEECVKPFEISGQTCSLSLSMGIAIFPDDGQDLESIVGAADTAMYVIKRGVKNGYAFAASKTLG